jgi:hypothetical protein
MLLTAVAMAAVAFTAVPANATYAVEIFEADGTTMCPASSPACPFHVEGEFTLFGHLFGIESVEGTCHVELGGDIVENGNGSISTYVPTNGSHGETNCASPTFAPPCTSSLPWPFTTEEVAAGSIATHLDMCINPGEIGTCSGEFRMSGVETGATSERQHYGTTDLRIGTSSFCELTLDVESEDFL